MPFPHDDEIAALQVPFAAKAGAAASLLFGGVALALFVQTAAIFRIRGTTTVALVVMLVLALAAVVGGFRALRGSHGATVLAMGVGAVGTLGFGVWAAALLVSGVVSLLSFVAVPMALLAAVANGLALEPARKLGDARRRMKEQGLDLGL